MSNSTQKLAQKGRIAKDWTSRVKFEGLDIYKMAQHQEQGELRMEEGDLIFFPIFLIRGGDGGFSLLSERKLIRIINLKSHSFSHP